MIFHWLNSVPYSQRVTLLVVMVGLIWSGFYTMVWQPTTDEIEALKENVLHTQQEIDNQTGRASELSEMEGKSQRFASLGFTQGAIASPTTQSFRFRKDVMRIAGDYGLPLTIWDPGRLEKYPETGMHRRPIQARFEGGYHQIAEGLATILELPWALEINQLRLRVTSDVAKKRPSLVADFQLVGLVSSPLADFPHSINN